MVSHLLWEQGIGGSSPSTQTMMTAVLALFFVSVEPVGELQCRSECYKEERLCLDACGGGDRECRRYCRFQRDKCFDECEE